jgi:predicted acylesterase/phospholipase RssA
VVGVDISPAVEPVTAAPFDPGLSGWRVLAHRINPMTTAQEMPSVIDIISRATGLSGTRQRRAALSTAAVDLLVHPPVPAIGVLDFKAGAALIETGYRHAAEAIEQSGLPKHFQAITIVA